MPGNPSRSIAGMLPEQPLVVEVYLRHISLYRLENAENFARNLTHM
jgi:hypothetical protein